MDWEAVYRKHSSGVYQYLLNLSGHLQEAEDLLQETFIRAIDSKTTLREADKMRPWLLTISRNLFLDSKKKQVRQKTSSLENSVIDEINMPKNVNNPEDYALKSDFLSRLHKALADLSETYRTAFTLGVMQKLAYQEIVEITGWSLAMVKSNVFRARKTIAAALSEFQG